MYVFVLPICMTSEVNLNLSRCRAEREIRVPIRNTLDALSPTRGVADVVHAVVVVHVDEDEDALDIAEEVSDDFDDEPIDEMPQLIRRAGPFLGS